MVIRRRSKFAGFTLIELLIVISIMAILLSVATVSYKQSILHAKESVLRQDLNELRNAIDSYTSDKKKAPQSLDDVASAGYLRGGIPKDPMTNQADWTPVSEDTMQALDQTQPGIDDVHSSSNLIGSDGTAYSSW